MLLVPFGANAITQLKLVGVANAITRHTLALSTGCVFGVPSIILLRNALNFSLVLFSLEENIIVVMLGEESITRVPFFISLVHKTNVLFSLIKEMLFDFPMCFYYINLFSPPPLPPPLLLFLVVLS